MEYEKIIYTIYSIIKDIKLQLIMIYNTSKINIAFLGPKGSYSHIAAIQYARYYCNQIIEHSCKNFAEIFFSVENYQAEYGILPIENSNSGLIEEVCDLLLKTNLVLIEDITIPIQHRILANNPSSLKKIQIIYSHPQPVQQCSNFLKNFSQWKIVSCTSSSVAIKIVASLKKNNIAALGNAQSGIFYGLHPLFPENISNLPYNTTRFIIVKNKNFFLHKTQSISIPQKIMLIISINQKLKKLCKILRILQFYNIKINFLRMQKIFCNNKKNIIILEIETYLNSFYTHTALIKIKKISCSLKILGCYSSLKYY